MKHLPTTTPTFGGSASFAGAGTCGAGDRVCPGGCPPPDRASGAPPSSLRPLITPTLAALALLGAAASGHALSVKDDDVSLGLKFQLQLRAQFLNNAKSNPVAPDSGGNQYDPLRGQNGDPEAVRFYLRRVRVGFEAKLANDWKAAITLRGVEPSDRNETLGTRTAEVYYAYGAKSFKQDDLTHTLELGLHKAVNGESTLSSSAYAFPQISPAQQMMDMRNAGLSYILEHPNAMLAATVRNSMGTANPKDAQAQDSVNRDESNGFLWGVRVQGQYSDSGKAPKRQESYCGRNGTDAIVGFDVFFDDNAIVAPGAASAATGVTAGDYGRQDTLSWGPDLIVHADQLTFLAEYKRRNVEVTQVRNSNATVDSQYETDSWAFNTSLAYAMPTDTGTAYEVAARYARYDNQATGDNKQNYGNFSAEGEASVGHQYVAGLSAYWFGNHSCKTQVSWQHWRAEAGNGRANIIVLQQSFAF